MDIIEQLKRDEGLRLVPYRDSVGIWTAGYGHNLQSHNGSLNPITQEQADSWLEDDADAAHVSVLKWLPWASKLSDARFGVLQNMCFNMGIGNQHHGLLSFSTFLGLVRNGKYEEASQDEIHTKWSVEVGARADRLANQMRTDQWT